MSRLATLAAVAVGAAVGAWTAAAFGIPRPLIGFVGLWFTAGAAFALFTHWIWGSDA